MSIFDVFVYLTKLEQINLYETVPNQIETCTHFRWLRAINWPSTAKFGGPN